VPTVTPNDWYPAWVRELLELDRADAACLFVLHGNVHDLFRCDEAGRYGSLADFLGAHVYRDRDLVLQLDLASGLSTAVGADAARHQQMMKLLTARLGEWQSWPRDVDQLLGVLDQLIYRKLLGAESFASLVLLMDHAQYLAPAADLGSLTRGQSVNLVRLLGWAQNPYIKAHHLAFFLMTDALGEVNERLVRSPHVAALEVPLPDLNERLHFLRAQVKQEDWPKVSEFAPEQMAELSNGLSLLNLSILIAQARQAGQRLDAARFRDQKKRLIERQCRGLLEFVQPRHTLDLVVGQEAAKQRLQEDAALIAQGNLSTAPMGYLLCGPVGTGKSFLAECYAGSIGIPCVVLRNFRSKYVGETEGNLQQILTVLRSLGPVVVVIDEADAALGTREAEGDSGTSSRVFSMIAGQMGDTRYRGRIIWMLLTSRPDLLPIDLKRQGRAEVHIPLFYPQSEAEIRAMFEALARKNKVALQAGAIPAVKPERQLSGADIESVLLAAWRAVLTRGGAEVEKRDLEQALTEFIPSAQGLEKQRQEIAAVLECTQLSFLPERWRKIVTEPEGRARLQEKLVELAI
jgi:AAA+ superfamily predicted ATPase